jgi:hypothetical protein
VNGNELMRHLVISVYLSNRLDKATTLEGWDSTPLRSLVSVPVELVRIEIFQEDCRKIKVSNIRSEYGYRPALWPPP